LQRDLFIVGSPKALGWLPFIGVFEESAPFGLVGLLKRYCKALYSFLAGANLAGMIIEAPSLVE